MSQAFICDRCDNVFTQEQRRNFAKSPLAKFNKFYIHNEEGFDEDQPDLCPACICKLNAWMNEFVNQPACNTDNSFYKEIEKMSGLPLFPALDYDMIHKKLDEIAQAEIKVIDLDDGVPRGPLCVHDFVDCIEPDTAFGIFGQVAREFQFIFFNAIEAL